MTKKILLLCFFGLITPFAIAQEIILSEYDENGKKGYSVNLVDADQKAEDFLRSYFRESGKVRYRDGYYQISNLSRADFPYTDIILYGNVELNTKESLAYILLEDTLMADEEYAARLKDLWYTFSLEFYRHLVQEEIDESMQALKYTERQYERLERDSLNLQSDLVDNREEKKELEEALKINEFDYNVLLQKIIDNKGAKDSLILSIEKIKKLIEVQEEEKRGIK